VIREACVRLCHIALNRGPVQRHAEDRLNLERHAEHRIRLVTTKRYTGIDARHFDVVKNAMRDVFEGAHGTARYNQIEGIDAGGKTGTVQNPHGEDHSLFIAFAPFDVPKIAISVVVENAGYGSQWAAPIATLMIEKYLTGDIKRKELEEKILNKNFNEEAHAEQQ
jgi:penicillin-binding protein 2